MSSTLDRLRRSIDAFSSATVLIVGDLMLDQFVVGRVNRISPEAPVPVVEYDHDDYRIGGAANVANNVRALGGNVELVGLTGSDAAGLRLRHLLAACGIGTSGLVEDQTRRTTTKLRIVTTRNLQVARIDYESDHEVSGDAQEAIAAQVDRLAPHANVILVSDYLKGTVTREVMARVVAAGRARGIPVLVDPKIPHMPYYAGATLVTPNHHEAEVATHRRIRTAEDAVAAAHLFRERAGCLDVLITRGEHGMCLLAGPDAVQVHGGRARGVGRHRRRRHRHCHRGAGARGRRAAQRRVRSGEPGGRRGGGEVRPGHDDPGGTGQDARTGGDRLAAARGLRRCGFRRS